MTIIGIDYGRKRLGVAVSDSGHRLATPLTVIERGAAGRDLQEIRRIAEEYAAALIVLGLPVRTDGKAGDMAEETKAFGEKLREHTGLNVEFWDERFSTAQAEKAMLGADISRKRRREKIDKVAAQIILQSYLDAQNRAQARQ